MKNLLLILSFLVLTASSAYSQIDDPPRDREPIDREDFREKLIALKKEKLMEIMSLDETTADRLFAIVTKTMDQIKDYNKQKRTVYLYIEQNPDASDMDSKINELFDLDIKIANAKKDQYEELKLFLTPKQIAEAYVFNRKFDQELRKKFKDVRGKDKDRSRREKRKDTIDK
jgi:hypothetical protein